MSRQEAKIAVFFWVIVKSWQFLKCQKKIRQTTKFIHYSLTSYILMEMSVTQFVVLAPCWCHECYAYWEQMASP